MNHSSTNSIHFALTLNFLTPKEQDIHCLHEVMLTTKLTHTYTYYKFIQRHYIHSSQSRNPHHHFMFINSEHTSPCFLNFTYCIKSTNLNGILRNYDPVRQMFIFCPLTNNFPLEDARPIIMPHEYIQPIEVALLENIHNIKINHKLFNLIQSSSHEFSAITEEVNISRAFELPWPLLRTKNVKLTRAKLLITSDTIKTHFAHGFFLDPETS